MSKEFIKSKIRENILSRLKETPNKNDVSKEKDDSNKDNDYSSIQDKLTHTLLKQSQVMAAAGLGDPNDANDRSLFSKKLRRIKNDKGSEYKFSDEEVASIIKVLDNPAAYLNIKK